MNWKYVLVYLAALVVAVFVVYRTAHHDYYNAITITGATPLAVMQKVPPEFSLVVDGMVKKTYTLSSSALRAFATTRIRTKEVSVQGEFEGTYIYVGVPVFNILEGVAPAFREDSLMDTPTDFLITFSSDSGKKVCFSYGELLMTDDEAPVTLAFYRQELLPSKDPEKYTVNIRKRGLHGFRLIAPRERDTARYLDHVERITLSVPTVHSDLLPERRKNFDCAATDITALLGDKVFMTGFDGVEKVRVDEWIRVGHGKGYKGTASVEGYSLRSFLKLNFPGCGFDNYFLFVSCDGYRCLFSGREIFGTCDGEDMILIKSMDGKEPAGGNMLACIGDYFIDRSIWGVTHVVVLTPEELQTSLMDTM